MKISKAQTFLAFTEGLKVSLSPGEYSDLVANQKTPPGAAEQVVKGTAGLVGHAVGGVVHGVGHATNFVGDQIQHYPGSAGVAALGAGAYLLHRRRKNRGY